MPVEERIIPFNGINVDIHESLLPTSQARFIKNLSYDITDTSSTEGNKGAGTGVAKVLQGNEVYGNIVLPAGYNHTIGRLSCPATKEVYVWVYNDKGDHFIYRIDGLNEKTDMVYSLGSCLNFQLNPEYFVHFGGAHLEVVYLTHPITGRKIKRSFLIFTDGFQNQFQICVEDSIATQSFNETLFPYFQGANKCLMVRAGVPTPKDCIQVSEIPPTVSSISQTNRVLYNTWQFRLQYTDVWGRPSFYGPMSDQYVPGTDCISSSNSLPNCLKLSFKAPEPYIDKVAIAYRNCNSRQWYTSDVLELYSGSSIGEWWLRSRNPDVDYDPGTGTINYKFCADKECTPIAPADTNVVGNPQPRVSQSVLKIDKYIAFAGNKDGFLPFSKELRSKFKVTVETPTSETAETNAFRNITVWAEIFNPFTRKNQPIYRQAIASGEPQAYGFGDHDDRIPFNVQYRSFFAYKQYFKNLEQKGFIGYLRGTDIFTISKQYVLSNGSFTQVTDFVNLKTYSEGARYFQKFEFTNVPKGTYLFSIAGHQSKSTDINFRDTSTYVAGSFKFNTLDSVNPVDHTQSISTAKEIVINVCNENYDSAIDKKALVVFDLVHVDVAIEQGYVYNTDSSTEVRKPIELLNLRPPPRGVNSTFTDHNGFYFIATTAESYIYGIEGYCGCNLINLFTVNKIVSGSQDKIYENTFYMNKSTCKEYATQKCNEIKIKGKVKICGTEIGVPNVSVILSRGQYAVTNNDGEFTITAHDEVGAEIRHDKIYFLPNKCGFTACNDGCIAPLDISIPKCTVFTQVPVITCAERIINVASTFIKAVSKRGLLKGGTYPVAVTPWDWLGRAGYAQDLGLIYIPSINESKSFSPSRVRVDILAGAIFPPEVEYLTFSFGAETTISDYITWIIDSVQFIDNTGLENNTNPTQIKLYYASLIEYSKQNGYNTTVNWAFIDAEKNTPVLSDKIQFLLNGDGTFFDKPITSIVKYDKAGQYILINYTPELKDLKANAVVRIERPKQCTGTEPVFEVCSTVNIIGRTAQVNSLYLNGIDTYYVYREIPVPVLQPSDPTITPAAAPVFINEQRILGVPFEHHSPSDFWGYKCSNRGRENAKNPYETELYHREQFALSGAMSENNQLNYLNFFSESKKTSFGSHGINGIISAISKAGRILVIGQNGCFLVGFNDNLIRVKNDGTVEAGSTDNAFGKPQNSQEFGCPAFYKNTIYEKDGIVEWMDSTKTGIVQHDFNSGIIISKNGADSLIKAKIKAVEEYNLTHDNKRYFVGVVNPAAGDYLVTDFIIRSNTFINNLRQYEVTAQETFVFGIRTRMFKGTVSFTAESYGELEGEINNQQLFSFKNGVPYRHYSMAPKTFLNFYGVQCEPICEIVIVIDNLKKKRALSLGQYCKQGLYFVDRVISETGQQTRMLIDQWIQAEYGHFAPFLCDMKTLPDSNLPEVTKDENALFDGNMITGTWIKVRLVGSPDMVAKYSELQGITVSVFASEKSGT